MPRIEVPFVVKKQHIKRVTEEDLVAGGQNYFYAIFDIGNNWKKLSHIKASFVRDDVKKIVDLYERDGHLECAIPWEVMATAGVFQVGLFGGDRLPTHYSYVKVKKGCMDEGDEPEAPTPDWFTNVERMCAAAVQTANSIEERANNGEFNGEPGEKGDTGESGYTPVKGVDYFDGKDGLDGLDGLDGYTPVYGEDYFTEEEKEQFVKEIIESLPEDESFVEISADEIDNVYDGVYKVKDFFHDSGTPEGYEIYGVLTAGYRICDYEPKTFDLYQMIVKANGEVLRRTRYADTNYNVFYSTDGERVYFSKEDFEKTTWKNWTKWQSVIPSLTAYATKTYVGEQIDDVTDALSKNELELIASGVTTEEVNGIIISEDNDGNPFELCDMVTIYSMSPIGKNTTNLSYVFDNSLIQQSSNNGVSETSAIYHRLVGIHSGKRWDAYCYSVGNISANCNVVTRDRYGQTTEKTVKSIKLYLYNSAYVLPVGFEYEIYGRRVKNANT